jgi:hypothetical protein
LGYRLSKIPLYPDEVNTTFEYLLDEYLNDDVNISEAHDQINGNNDNVVASFDTKEEEMVVATFLKTPCPCLKNCQKLLNHQEAIKNRAFFRSLEKQERNYILLSILKFMLTHSAFSLSGRSKKSRKRKKFDYCISIDRPVCKTVFLFYYGETSKRLDRLKSCVTKESLTPPIHGNSGRTPTNAYNMSDREKIKSFILNFAAIHGLPDPGRDIRKGKGKLRILLPSIMTYKSIHQQYSTNIKALSESPVSYRTFLKIWQEDFSHIKFNNPRSDLCMTCEDFKKQLNQVTAILDEGKEKKQAQIHKKALDHLKHVKKERLLYQATTKVAKKHYKKLIAHETVTESNEPNSKDIMAHYSWDFAQQIHYPFEDQQVGPIFFKTPKKAQLFGICCEGIPRQYNYLINEDNYTDKSANTVISLLDHFFTNYGLGEKWVHLTADNCVGQNKNNALIQYLMYRVLTGLHDRIELSFLVVGHTKFSPDGYFGLIKRHYRRSQVYTYEQLAHIIESSTKNDHNRCVQTSKSTSPVIYRDWTSWLSKYFETLNGITSYHHFVIEKKYPSSILVKKQKDSEEFRIDITRKKFPFSKSHQPKRLPKRLYPEGLSLKRQWYLFEKIRCHIPSECDKDKTCPKPKQPKSDIKN